MKNSGKFVEECNGCEHQKYLNDIEFASLSALQQNMCFM